tara:strand:- start:1274 stop:3655 length:2382 start_codon:yes stop_codon:yes gene_type:complete
MFNEKQSSFLQLQKIILESRKPVAFWVGAGVSADSNLPNWNELRKMLYEAAMESIVETVGVEGDELELELEQAKITTDLWDAFETFKKISGETTYKSIIQETMRSAEGKPPTEVLKKIWEIKSVKGIITLNIDGIEEKAHREIRKNEVPDVFNGNRLRHHISTISSTKPFIARLHGDHKEYDSWVFTKSELKKILNDSGYNTSINILLASYTIVFIGISAEDVAVGGFCEKLKDQRVDIDPHYWITDRKDKETTDWAEKNGIQKITYTAHDAKQHTAVTTEILTKLSSGKSKDFPGDVIKYPGPSLIKIPDSKDFRLMDENESRIKLNQHALHIIETTGGTDNTEYANFLQEYSLPIHQSWHLSEKDSSNTFFDYKINRRIKSGTFSNVWEIENQEGTKLALKIIQLENLRKGTQLDSFRRGVKSQRLLSESEGISGFANLISAFEIPPSVVMELIQGSSLQEISQQNGFNLWLDGLNIAIELCRSLFCAHNSKDGIIHRDVRPSNIMLPYYYFGEDATEYGGKQHEVRLLNYDMSWHKDASGKVIPGNALETGYYCPELLEHSDSELSRTTKVDSYGLGMTLYFMATRQTPPVAGSKSYNWIDDVKKIKVTNNDEFPIAANILQRIIVEATHPTISERITVSEIEGRLRELRDTIQEGIKKCTIEQLAELLIFKCTNQEYKVQKNESEYSWSIKDNRTINIKASRTNGLIHVTFTNQQAEYANWKKIDSRWQAKLELCRGILESGGWKILNGTKYQSRTIFLTAEISKDQLIQKSNKISDTLERGLQKIRID